jgi:hypothetical protein
VEDRHVPVHDVLKKAGLCSLIFQINLVLPCGSRALAFCYGRLLNASGIAVCTGHEAKRRETALIDCSKFGFGGQMPHDPSENREQHR